MDENSTKQSENLLFPELFSLDPVERKRVEVSFTAPDLSSRGGLLLLGELEYRLGLIDRLTGCLEDKRCPWLDKALKAYREKGEEVRLFRQFTYKAGSWEHAKRVIVKIEVNHRGPNVRFIVTNLEHPNSRFIYESLYCGRGIMELYITEMKVYLSADRCSCNRFFANQFRLFVHAAAYALLHALKETVLKGTCLYNASILTLRQKILCGAVHVRTLKTRIRIEFSDKHPYRNELSLAFQRFSL